ncbi:hypothetical protein J8273_6328 [Carpediemonas membranifera]|uniref:Uncharacterized protein n=1 Tax=Carpediemonas membranifera TaxID=201153 RepID=A0A8J6AYI7_9EUKA|nr:hypothetical protein J8273_6328 [Carpediemonas membranifera]|eukprot:KAG9391563.1 hypothetical protein J8273_6328 [Carpediemonas membranifera]
MEKFQNQALYEKGATVFSSDTGLALMKATDMLLQRKNDSEINPYLNEALIALESTMRTLYDDNIDCAFDVIELLAKNSLALSMEANAFLAPVQRAVAQPMTDALVALLHSGRADPSSFVMLRPDGSFHLDISKAPPFLRQKKEWLHHLMALGKTTRALCSLGIPVTWSEIPADFDLLSLGSVRQLMERTEADLKAVFKANPPFFQGLRAEVGFLARVYLNSDGVVNDFISAGYKELFLRKGSDSTALIWHLRHTLVTHGVDDNHVARIKLTVLGNESKSDSLFVAPDYTVDPYSFSSLLITPDTILAFRRIFSTIFSTRATLEKLTRLDKIVRVLYRTVPHHTLRRISLDRHKLVSLTQRILLFMQQECAAAVKNMDRVVSSAESSGRVSGIGECQCRIALGLVQRTFTISGLGQDRSDHTVISRTFSVMLATIRSYALIGNRLGLIDPATASEEYVAMQLPSEKMLSLPTHAVDHARSAVTSLRRYVASVKDVGHCDRIQTLAGDLEAICGV